jgi:hypothetical protein
MRAGPVLILPPARAVGQFQLAGLAKPRLFRKCLLAIPFNIGGRVAIRSTPLHTLRVRLGLGERFAVPRYRVQALARWAVRSVRCAKSKNAGENRNHYNYLSHLDWPKHRLQTSSLTPREPNRPPQPMRELDTDATLAGNPLIHWRALRESNPCFRRERAASWTARRRARATRERRCGKGATYKVVWRNRQATAPACPAPPPTRHQSPVTSARYWASTSTAPSAAARNPSATARSTAYRASARTPSCRRAAAGG